MTSGNYAGVTPEWSDSQVPAVKVTGVYLYLPVPGSRPAFFHRYFFAHSLKMTKQYNTDRDGYFRIQHTSADYLST